MGIWGITKGSIIGGIQGNDRSLDSGSCGKIKRSSLGSSAKITQMVIIEYLFSEQRLLDIRYGQKGPIVLRMAHMMLL